MQSRCLGSGAAMAVMMLALLLLLEAGRGARAQASVAQPVRGLLSSLAGPDGYHYTSENISTSVSASSSSNDTSPSQYIHTNHNTTSGNGTGSGAAGASTASDGQAFEFVAFLAWYVFLLLCCVVPACCALRRRRIMEHQMAVQRSDLARLQAQGHNWFLWAAAGVGPPPPGTTTTPSPPPLPVDPELRARLLTEALRDTTVVVAAEQLVPAGDAEDGASGLRDVPLDDAASALEHGFDFSEHGTESGRRLLELPEGRTVQTLCAICLSQYEPGDSVTWSAHCPHAFHTDCVVGWLAKKQHCPICRRDFGDLAERARQDLELARVMGSGSSGGGGNHAAPVPWPSIFSIEPSGRLVAVSFAAPPSAAATPSGGGGGANNGGPPPRTHRWITWPSGAWGTAPPNAGGGSLILEALRRDPSMPIRIQLPSLANPRTVYAESQRRDSGDTTRDIEQQTPSDSQQPAPASNETDPQTTNSESGASPNSDRRIGSDSR